MEYSEPLSQGNVETQNNSTLRSFHLGDILSITTGALVSPRHMEGVYDILNYLADDNLFTHQLLRACRECRPFLAAQHPQLADIDATGINKDNWREWMDRQTAIYGETLPVSRVPASAHIQKHPLAELVEMGAKNVIACDTSPESADALIKCLKTEGAPSVQEGNEKD